MKRMPDGTVISSYFDLVNTPSGNDLISDGLKLAVGQVVKVHYIDDKTNLSQKYVEYDVLVKDMKAGLIQFKNVRKAESAGAFNDYSEEVLEPADYAIKGKLEDGNSFKNKTGTIVILGFIDGIKDKPVILTALPHPLRDGAKKADGVRKKGEFRGVQWEINKDGEFILTHQGPRGADGKLKTSDKVLTIVKFDKNGNLTVNDKAKNQIKLNNTDVKVEIQSDSKGIKLELDGKNDKITFTTSGGPKVTVDGSNMITLEVGSTKIIIDGNAGKIKLDGSLVDIGTGASAFAVLGPQLISWLTSHTHMGAGGLIPAPTSPPLIPPPPSLLSTSVKIKE